MSVLREWVIPLAFSSLIPLAIIAGLLYRLRIERKFGKPLTPTAVTRLMDDIANNVSTFDPVDHSLIGIINGRKLFRRFINDPIGQWEVNVEVDGNELIAVEAIFQSPHSAALFKKIRGNRKRPRILVNITTVSAD